MLSLTDDLMMTDGPDFSQSLFGKQANKQS